jgi:hypothetical protein
MSKSIPSRLRACGCAELGPGNIAPASRARASRRFIRSPDRRARVSATESQVRETLRSSGVPRSHWRTASAALARLFDGVVPRLPSSGNRQRARQLSYAYRCGKEARRSNEPPSARGSLFPPGPHARNARRQALRPCPLALRAEVRALLLRSSPKEVERLV